MGFIYSGKWDVFIRRHEINVHKNMKNLLIHQEMRKRLDLNNNETDSSFAALNLSCTKLWKQLSAKEMQHSWGIKINIDDERWCSDEGEKNFIMGFAK